ncbi:MAG: hypothetical protein AVDCRST_MAG17-1972 [uncultured Solirubrobacterales bacterium]|uniref:Fibronectin type-III domain-containing protein n=1 Tax=uncultured Solirubrobacterales bacterium TaxID=768556 RepID=A0A6J4T133_9ACTN|nr:MAG: hypothetical protein AVDCRST_MAG17-1972 [uncultured Solirubrobacterales bacterium]
MRRAIATSLLAASLIGAGTVAAPALSTREYIPEPVDFEIAPVGVAAGQTSGDKVVSRPVDAPKRFDTVGVRWNRGDAETDVDVRVRSEGGAWSDWTEATADIDHGPDPGRGERTVTRASAPVWTGGSDEVQYRTSERLGGVTLEFSNTTGTATAADRAETALRRAANKGVTGVASFFSASAAAPSMVSRSEWGGDRYCRPRSSPATGSVKAVFVHHTADANGYSRSEASSMVLGICRYHRDTNGWSDIGYNFLVDKYGRLYEGRAGGISRAVVGAQAQGWNAQSTGVANLGTYESGGQTSAALGALDRLITWKLDAHRTPRGGRVTLTSAGGSSNRYAAGTRVSFNRISGHRDGNRTSCPGSALYRQIPRLRTAVEEGSSDTTAPSAPRNLGAVNGAGSVALNWSDNGESDLAGYRVYRRQADASYQSIATVRSSKYTDTSVRGGETYYYRVKAYDASGNHSTRSNLATGQPTSAFEQIVDNADASRFTASSGWKTSNRVSGRYGADYRHAAPVKASDPAQFRLRAPRSGSYAIYIRHPAHPDYSSSAPIRVQTRAGTKETRLDLREDGGRWVGVGTYSLAAGEEPSVLVSRWTSAPGSLIADAVRLVER